MTWYSLNVAHIKSCVQWEDNGRGDKIGNVCENGNENTNGRLENSYGLSHGTRMDFANLEVTFCVMTILLGSFSFVDITFSN